MLVVVVALAALVPVALVGASYNRFSRQRQAIRNAWANVDAELQRRHDLLPSIVATVRAYASHERETLEAVTAARATATAAAAGRGGAGGDVAEQASAEARLAGAAQRLVALAEAYPRLHADRQFAELQRQLTRTEDRIEATRRVYNHNVRAYNERVASVPSNIVARVFAFRAAPYFEVEAAGRTTPAVALA